MADHLATTALDAGAVDAALEMFVIVGIDGRGSQG